MSLQNHNICVPYFKGIFAVTDIGRVPFANCTDTYMYNAHFEEVTVALNLFLCLRGTSTVKLSMLLYDFLVNSTTQN